MSNEERLRNEILAVMWRYSKESNVTILEAIKAAHQAAERIAEIALNAKAEE
jgi:septum formation topological specificity factor MinE